MPARGNIYIEVTPEPAVVAEVFFAKRDKLQDLETPLRMSAEIMAREVAANFDAQGRPTEWAPLAQSTIERRIMSSLSESQRANLANIKADSAFEGSLETDASGVAHFIPSSSNKYAAIMAGLGSSLKILIDSGALQAGGVDAGSYRYRSLGFNSQSVEVPDPTGYGVYHITGAPATNLPQRDWTYIADEAVDEMTEVMADWVMSG
jgi:phage gpG-like protein